jgi:hypothetical protein
MVLTTACGRESTTAHSRFRKKVKIRASCPISLYTLAVENLSKLTVGSSPA